MAKDRSRDDRRSVGSHEKMTAALGKAAGWFSRDTDFGRAALGGPSGRNNFVMPGKGHVSVNKAGAPDKRVQGTEGIK